AQAAVPEGLSASRAPLSGRLVEVSVSAGALVLKGQPIAVIEAMKMEYTVVADFNGRVVEVPAASGGNVLEGEILVLLEQESSGVD
ncbi:acetyl-CoA carboxylase biotin carboxyl carrier protein subunit, partial [Variovorax sp. 2RAF20]